MDEDGNEKNFNTTINETVISQFSTVSTIPESGEGRRTSTPNHGSVVSLFDMSGSNLNFNLGSNNVITSQPQPQNLASASVNAATSLLYSSGLNNSGSSLRGYAGVDTKSQVVTEETKQKSSSLAGRYTVNTMSNGSNGSSTTGVGYSNGSSLTGTGNYNANGGNYRLASLDRLAQRQKLYENGSAVGDNVSIGGIEGGILGKKVKVLCFG